MKKLFLKLASNIPLLGLSTLIYIAVLGPFLISAASTIAVLLGLVLAAAIAYWWMNLRAAGDALAQMLEEERVADWEREVVERREVLKRLRSLGKTVSIKPVSTTQEK